MQVEDCLSTADSYAGTPFYFSAILYRTFEFWVAGPSAPTRQAVLQELVNYHDVIKVQITKTYVPYVQ